MKNILIAFALFFSTISFAQNDRVAYRFEANNKTGGKIVLLDAKCVGPDRVKIHEGWNAAYSYSVSGKVIRGCWRYGNGEVNVIWHDLEENIYPAGIFVPIYE